MHVQGAKGLHGFVGVCVHGMHEPAWLIGANGDRAYVKGTESLADASEFRMEASIARVKETAGWSSHRISTPQGSIAIEWRACAEVARRRTGDRCITELDRVPPVDLFDLSCSESA